jgi:hypothetical protein
MAIGTTRALPSGYGAVKQQNTRQEEDIVRTKANAYTYAGILFNIRMDMSGCFDKRNTAGPYLVISRMVYSVLLPLLICGRSRRSAQKWLAGDRGR